VLWFVALISVARVKGLGSGFLGNFLTAHLGQSSMTQPFSLVPSQVVKGRVGYKVVLSGPLGAGLRS